MDEVVPGSPADKAGLKQFDLIQKLDDQLLVDERQLSVLVHSHKPGETVTLAVIREGKPHTLKATLGEHEEVGEGEGQNRLMLQFAPPPGTPGLPGPEGRNLMWQAQGQPLPPGGPTPPHEGPKPPRAPNPVPQIRPAPPAETGAAGADDAARLEQEIRRLKATAEELRAQVKARQEAEERKAKEPQDKAPKDGAEKP